MRCHWRRHAFIAALILLFILYIWSPPSPLSNSVLESKGFLNNLAVWSVSSTESWIDSGHFLPHNVSYSLLAGTPVSKKKFLTIGLASVKRSKGSYLLDTLQSIFSHSSREEQSSMVVVVLLADFDAQWREDTVRNILAEFALQLERGQLLVTHVPQQFYPPLKDLKRNFNDAPNRVSFRSKQNVDYSFLLHYSSGRGHYYLMLEDDVASANHFLSTIRTRVRMQEASGVVWATLEFSSLGYIGKLYRSIHLPLLSRFLFLFYQEMPCDFLLSHFRLLLTQGEPILFKPSLFQHMGTFSSFQGTYNKLKDSDFEEERYTNPAADVYSDIPVYKNHIPGLAYAFGSTFFWGHTPVVGNHLTVVFHKAELVTGIVVETGSQGKDLLNFAEVELGRYPITTETGSRTCKDFSSLGPLVNGRFEMQEVEKKSVSTPSCLRIRVTGNQSDWVVITKIRIKTDGN